jgi:hypothetical protein
MTVADQTAGLISLCVKRLVVLILGTWMLLYLLDIAH